jgi:hypothetical protein
MTSKRQKPVFIFETNGSSQEGKPHSISLCKTLEHGEFALNLQPFVILKIAKVSAREKLIRLHQPK